MTPKQAAVLRILWRGSVCGGLLSLLLLSAAEFPFLLPAPSQLAVLILSTAVSPLPEETHRNEIPCLPDIPEFTSADLYREENGANSIETKKKEKETAENESQTTASEESESLLPHIPDGAHLIRKTDLSSPPGNAINQTSYALPELPQTLPASSSLSVPLDPDHPLVLVLHTHGTEAYSDNGLYYTDNTPTRSENTSHNVVAVGDVFCDHLTALGIPLIHCRTMFDETSYNDAYSLSGKAVAEYLEKYPSIRYIFDLHRDSIVYADKTKARPLSEEGRAQIMFVVGSDEGGAAHPRWQENYALAEKLHRLLNEQDATVCRAVNLRSASFNQQLSSGFLLTEIGSCGNTLAEAEASAVLLAKAVAALLGIGTSGE